MESVLKEMVWRHAAVHQVGQHSVYAWWGVCKTASWCAIGHRLIEVDYGSTSSSLPSQHPFQKHLLTSDNEALTAYMVQTRSGDHNINIILPLMTTGQVADHYCQ